jgi:hypothetical protein
MQTTPTVSPRGRTPAAPDSMHRQREPAFQRIDQRAFDIPGKHGGPQISPSVRRLPIEAIGLAAAVLATVVTYALFIAHPVSHEPLSAFLARFARGNAAIWPMQLIWYASAGAMVWLAVWPRRHSTQLICLLAAAYLAWVGIAYFAILDRGTHVAWMSGLLAGAFLLEGVLLLFAGLVRRDLVIRPRWDRWDLASVLGAVCIAYALVAYPLLGILGGHPLAVLPVFGFSPCASTVFVFGLLLWARPPAPTYLLPIPLALALGTGPGGMATGVVADVVLALAGVITALILLWRDRTSPWQTLVAGGVLTVMIVESGHDDRLLMVALILVAVTLAQAIWGDGQRARSPRVPVTVTTHR